MSSYMAELHAYNTKPYTELELEETNDNAVISYGMKNVIYELFKDYTIYDYVIENYEKIYEHISPDTKSKIKHLFDIIIQELRNTTKNLLTYTLDCDSNNIIYFDIRFYHIGGYGIMDKLFNKIKYNNISRKERGKILIYTQTASGEYRNLYIAIVKPD